MSTLLPVLVLRSIAFNLYFLLLTVAMGLAAVPVRLFGRRHALEYSRRWAALSLAGLHRICGIELRISGLEHLPPGKPALIASQHRSAYDTLVWMNLVPRPAYVMKRELVRIPLVGPMLLLSGMIPLDRGGGARALRELLRATDAAIADGRQIVIFPEGTRVPDGHEVPLQPGIAALAARADLPVIPVATDSGRCWSRRSFLRRPGVIHLDLAPPLPAGLRRPELLAAIRNGWRLAEAARPVDNLVESRRRP
ncbi:MAG: 1-acyl-sn-glycerol-3-phosphate acyltransferase [Gluconacetobacter diazotrophicus]|nr:1-acyl-sn-glycerol-3-phosphate acyltransferase [Gluconacetobacter diazotrophicus]